MGSRGGDARCIKGFLHVAQPATGAPRSDHEREVHAALARIDVVTTRRLAWSYPFFEKLLERIAARRVTGKNRH